MKAITGPTTIQNDNSSSPTKAVYAVKRIAREHSLYDSPLIYDVFTEISCLEMLAGNRGVCELIDYGVHGAVTLTLTLTLTLALALIKLTFIITPPTLTLTLPLTLTITLGVLDGNGGWKNGSINLEKYCCP
jgi:hypothetical protein